MMRALVIPVAIAAVASASCNRQMPGVSCTEIGCEDGLSVQIVNAPATGPWRVEVSESGASRAFECPAGSPCGSSAFFPGFLPASVTVTVTVGDRSTTRSGAPSPRIVRPNGNACPPQCRQPVFSVTAP